MVRKRKRSASKVADDEPASKRQCTSQELQPAIYENWLSRHNCRSINQFEIESELGSGSYGNVFKAKNKATKQIVALKLLKSRFSDEDLEDGITFREVNTCLASKHPNVVHIHEIVFGPNEVYISMEYLKSDLSDVIKSKRDQDVDFTGAEVKTLMRQLISAIEHMHKLNIVHRDLKPSNLLISAKGTMKVADFGFARSHENDASKPMTPGVVTNCYRAIELLLGVRKYSFAVDMWSIGCIFAELLLKKRLIVGQSEIEQIEEIFECFGNVDVAKWPESKQLIENICEFRTVTNPTFHSIIAPETTVAGFDLISKLFIFNPTKRIRACDALLHSFLSNE